MKVMKVMKASKCTAKAAHGKQPKVGEDGNASSSGSKVMKKPAGQEFSDAASVVSQALSATPSLNEKIEILKRSQLPVNEKVKLMNQKLSHPEWNKLNGRFATARNKDSDLDDVANTTPKILMRSLTTAWVLDPSKGEIFNSLSCNVSASHTMTKTSVWESEKSTLLKWSQDELDKHLNSGRIIWREDPCTPGVYEYKDTKNISEVKQIQRHKKKDYSQKSEITEEAFEDEMLELEGHWNNTGVESYNLMSLRGNESEGKGSTGSKGNQKGKGKGKLAIEDDPKKKLKAIKAALTSTIKSMGAWGFSQTNMQPKVKKTLQQNIKILEKKADFINNMQEDSIEDMNKFVAETMALISECKKVMD